MSWTEAHAKAAFGFPSERLVFQLRRKATAPTNIFTFYFFFGLATRWVPRTKIFTVEWWSYRRQGSSAFFFFSIIPPTSDVWRRVLWSLQRILTLFEKKLAEMRGPETKIIKKIKEREFLSSFRRIITPSFYTEKNKGRVCLPSFLSFCTWSTAALRTTSYYLRNSPPLFGKPFYF